MTQLASKHPRAVYQRCAWAIYPREERLSALPAWRWSSPSRSSGPQPEAELPQPCPRRPPAGSALPKSGHGKCEAGAGGRGQSVKHPPAGSTRTTPVFPLTALGQSTHSRHWRKVLLHHSFLLPYLKLSYLATQQHILSELKSIHVKKMPSHLCVIKKCISETKIYKKQQANPNYKKNDQFSVSNLMSFDKYIHIHIDIYAVTTSKIKTGHFHHWKIFPCALCSHSSLSPAPGNHWSGFCHYNFVFPRIHVNGTVEYVVFSVLILSHNAFVYQ